MGQVSRIINAAKDLTAKQVRSAVVQSLKELGARTPVDTGYARGNWQVGVGFPATGETGLRSVTSMLASGAGKLATYRNLRVPVFITNNVVYISKLDAGSSTQAPANFVNAALAAGVAKARGNRYGR